MQLMVDNHVLAPLLEHRRIPITIQRFRSLLSCLPTLSKKARDDSIFGAARFLANGLGIKLIDKPSANVLDESLSQTQYKQLWRTATFSCKCSLDQRKTINYETRSLCSECSYLIHRNSMNIPIPFTLCPSCNMIESWESIGAPCLSCQFASIIHQNPYSSRYERFLQTWLTTQSNDLNETDSDRTDEYYQQSYKRQNDTSSKYHPTQDQLLRLRQNAIGESLSNIRRNSTVDENRQTFWNLITLRKEIRDSFNSNNNSENDCDLEDRLGMNTQNSQESALIKNQDGSKGPRTKFGVKKE